jgi:hypothetical protein
VFRLKDEVRLTFTTFYASWKLAGRLLLKALENRPNGLKHASPGQTNSAELAE